MSWEWARAAKVRQAAERAAEARRLAERGLTPARISHYVEVIPRQVSRYLRGDTPR